MLAIQSLLPAQTIQESVRCILEVVVQGSLEDAWLEDKELADLMYSAKLLNELLPNDMQLTIPDN